MTDVQEPHTQELQQVNSNIAETELTSDNDELLDDIDIEYDDIVEEDVIESENKYTKIDNLDEDEPIRCQNYVCLSFVSPEGVMNTNLRSIKIRGVFDTEQEAKEHSSKLQKQDKYFDVFVGEVGKWLPWDPNPHDVKENIYKDKKMQKLVDAQRQNQSDKLNELVGRKKELMDKRDKAHKRRVAENIVSGTNEEGGAVKSSSNINNSSNNVNSKRTNKHKSNTTRLDNIRSRLRKKLKERENQNSTNNIDTIKTQLNEKMTKLNETTEELNKQKESMNKIENNINKIKQYMDSRSN
jgi:hypothetical protein